MQSVTYSVLLFDNSCHFNINDINKCNKSIASFFEFSNTNIFFFRFKLSTRSPRLKHLCRVLTSGEGKETDDGITKARAATKVKTEDF